LHPRIQERLTATLPLLTAKGIDILSQEPIDYGIQLRLQKDTEKASLNIYYSARKGVSMVIGAAQNSRIKADLEDIKGNFGYLSSTASPLPPLPPIHDWNKWIGSDECGKGDYFGPMVVCAFLMEREMIPQLEKIGVRDSKQLSDSQIVSISKRLYQEFPGQMDGIILKPLRFNEISQNMRQQKRNLNDLLAWQHSSVVFNLLKGGKKVDGILIDQFSKGQKAREAILTRQSNLKVLERTKAERDPAVAAASILARYQFLKVMEEMGKRYKTTFPLGATSRVDKAAREFVAKFGEDKLPEVAKIGFKNTERVIASQRLVPLLV